VTPSDSESARDRHVLNPLDYSRLTIRSRESDHPISITGREVTESDPTTEDVGRRLSVQRLDLFPQSWRGRDTSVLGHVGSDGQVGKVLDDGLPSARSERAISTPFVVVYE